MTKDALDAAPNGTWVRPPNPPRVPTDGWVPYRKVDGKWYEIHPLRPIRREKKRNVQWMMDVEGFWIDKLFTDD